MAELSCHFRSNTSEVLREALFIITSSPTLLLGFDSEALDLYDLYLDYDVLTSEFWFSSLVIWSLDGIRHRLIAFASSVDLISKQRNLKGD